MTPTLPIDVIIPGVGRVKKQSGVHTKAERDDLIAMLRLLPKQGYIELTRDIKAGRRKLLDVYAHFTAGTLEEFRGPHDSAPLELLLRRWLDEAEVAESTRLQRRDSFTHLQRCMRGKPLLRDLPALLCEFRAQCIARGHATTFNRARSAAQAFLRDTIGRHTNAWAKVSDVPTMKERRRGHQGLTVAEAVGIREDLAARSPKAARIWWTMCLTGMGPKEFFVDGFDVLEDRVRIHGAKRAGRERDVPLIDYPTRPELTRWGFTSALRRAGLTPYQARKTFDRWLQDAGIPRVRRKRYLGHGKRDVTDDYEFYEVAEYLRDDAAKLRAVLGPQKLKIVQ